MFSVPREIGAINKGMNQQGSYKVPCFRCKKQGLEVWVPLNGRCPRCKRIAKGSLGMSHYYAVCRRDTGWWVCDGTSIRKISEEEALRRISRDSCLVHYEKIS